MVRAGERPGRSSSLLRVLSRRATSSGGHMERQVPTEEVAPWIHSFWMSTSPPRACSLVPFLRGPRPGDGAGPTEGVGGAGWEGRNGGGWGGGGEKRSAGAGGDAARPLFPRTMSVADRGASPRDSPRSSRCCSPPPFGARLARARSRPPSSSPCSVPTSRLLRSAPAASPLPPSRPRPFPASAATVIPSFEYTGPQQGGGVTVLTPPAPSPAPSPPPSSSSPSSPSFLMARLRPAFTLRFLLWDSTARMW
jgi:hypothetical protein